MPWSHRHPHLRQHQECPVRTGRSGSTNSIGQNWTTRRDRRCRGISGICGCLLRYRIHSGGGRRLDRLSLEPSVGSEEVRQITFQRGNPVFVTPTQPVQIFCTSSYDDRVSPRQDLASRISHAQNRTGLPDWAGSKEHPVKHTLLASSSLGLLGPVVGKPALYCR